MSSRESDPRMMRFNTLTSVFYATLFQNGSFQLPYCLALRGGMLMRSHAECLLVGLSDRPLSGSQTKYLGRAFLLLFTVKLRGAEENIFILRSPNFVSSPYGHSLMKTRLCTMRWICLLLSMTQREQDLAF